MHLALHNTGQGLVAFGFTMTDELILIDAFTASITDPVLVVVNANAMARHECVG